MPLFPSDRFVRFVEMTDLLHAAAATHPDLMEISTIGSSFEDRPILLCTLTNAATGPHDEKPALWVDANIHATELTGSAAALHLIERLLEGYDTDETITRALDTRTFYVVPRVSPDGAELAMAEKPRWVRSSARAWPLTDQQPGLVGQDIDGDGRILTMRIEDPNGAWKKSAADARLLVGRDPTEVDHAQYYRLLTEGLIEEYDGVQMPNAPALAAIDMNRNYPVEWRPAGGQAGAGDYPASEPEIRAVVQGLIDRPNVCAFIQYHTYSGVHLRPYADKADDKMPTFDLWMYQEIGKKATEMTGYPAVGVHKDFRYDPKDVITGVGNDWAYDHRGVHAWVTEFWNPKKAAGVDDLRFIEWAGDHPFDDDLKMLAYADESVPGGGFVDWYPFDHPQLGHIEIGGFDTAGWIRNPPLSVLAEEIAPHADWAIWHALISPLLGVRDVVVERSGDTTWRIRLVVENTGYLPTQVTQRAIERKIVRPVEAEILLDPGATLVKLVGGRRKQQLGQLAGRARKTSMFNGFGAPSDGTPDRGVAEWVVEAAVGTRLDLVARHDRAGTVRTQVTLG